MNREILEKPFPKEKIKSRRGAGRMLDYVEAAEVIQKLTDGFDGLWSFEILDTVLLEKQILVHGKLSAEGITKEQYGSKDIVCFKGSSNPVSLADDYKAAATDALKKCATLFGVALHLYGDENDAHEPPAEKTPKPPAKTSEGHQRAPGEGETGKRVQSGDEKAVWAIANKLGLDKFTVCKFNNIECDTEGKWKTAMQDEWWTATRKAFKGLEDNVKWLCNVLKIEPALEFAEVVAMVKATWSWGEFKKAAAEAKETNSLNLLWTRVSEYRKSGENND